MRIARPAWAAAALAAWCLFLGAGYVLALARSSGVVAVLQPWWPATAAAAAAWTAGLFTLVAVWFAACGAAVRRPWLRWLLAVAGLAAVLEARGAAGRWSLWHDALVLDGVRIVAWIAALLALAPLLALLPDPARRAIGRPAAGWWALAVAALAAAFSTARIEIAATVVVNVVAWAFGAWALRRLAAGSAGTVLDAVLGWLLGLTVLALLAFALGCAGLWTRPAAGAVLAVLAGVAWRELVDGARAAFSTRDHEVLRWSEERAIGALVFVLLGTALVASLAPEVYSDAAGHHLAMADRMAREHRLAFWPQWNATAQINHGAMLFAWPTLFASPVAGKLQNFLLALAVPIGMAAFARRWLDARAGAWAIGVWVSAGLVLWLATTAYVDSAAAAYALGAAVAWFLWAETDDARAALVCGVFAGALMASKFVSASFVAPLFALIAAESALRWRRDGRRRLAPAIAYGAAALAVFAPWLVRAYVLTGNPIFPVLNDVFRSPYWEAKTALGDFTKMYGRPRSPAWPLLPWAMAFAPERLVEIGTLGPLLLALLPLAALARGWSRALLRLLALAALPTALWAAGVPYLRWFVLYLPFWALLAGSLLAALLRALPSGWRAAAAAAPFALMLATVAVDACTRGWWYQGASGPGLPLEVVRGRESADDYLRRHMISYAAVAWVNRAAPGARVLSPFFRDHLYEDTLMEGENASILPIRERRDAIVLAGDPETSWRRLRESGYQYLLVDGGDVHVNGPYGLRRNLYRPAFLARYARLQFAHHGAYLFRIAGEPGPDPQWPDPAAAAGNGGFELLDRSGMPYGWLREGDVAVDRSGSSAHRGRVAMRVGGWPSATAHHTSAAAATELAVGGARFVVITLAARAIDRVDQSWVDLRWMDGQGAILAESRLAFWPGTDWEDFFFADDVPAGAATVRISIGGRDPFFVDDVAVAPPPVAEARSIPPLVPAVAVYRPSESRFFLRGSNRADGYDLAVPFGRAGDLPLMGDWDGDGSVTVGVYRPADRSFHLKNANAAGPDDLVVALGAPGDLPVAGDWNGDGKTTVGVYRPADSVFHLLDQNASGAPETTVACGRPGPAVSPVAGDWDGSGRTGVGVYDANTNTFTLCRAGAAEVKADFGGPGDLPVAGDWDADGDDTVGVYRPANGTLYVRQSNTSGYAERFTAVGITDGVPVPGSSRLTLGR